MTFPIIMLIVCFVIFVIATLATDECPSYKGATITCVMLAILFAMIVAAELQMKETAKAFLDGKPTHEKQYVFNSKGEKVDSLYVKIHETN